MTSAGKLLAIKLPDNKITKLSVSANTTVGEACDILLRNLTVNAGEEYGITMDSIVFDRSSKIAKIPAVRFLFSKEIIFLLFKIIFTLTYSSNLFNEYFFLIVIVYFTYLKRYLN